MSTAKVQYELEVSPEMDLKLRQLALKLNSTTADVLRKAVALLDIAVEAKEQGEKIGLAKDKKQLDQEIVL